MKILENNSENIEESKNIISFNMKTKSNIVKEFRDVSPINIVSEKSENNREKSPVKEKTLSDIIINFDEKKNVAQLKDE